jgi:hypothetical protein
MEECRLKVLPNSVKENKLIWIYEDSNVWRLEEISLCAVIAFVQQCMVVMSALFLVYFV